MIAHALLPVVSGRVSIFAAKESVTTAQSEAAWEELKEALSEEPGELPFRAVASILDTWPGSELAEALAFADGRLASWPDEVRVAPWTWCVAAAKGETPPSLALARAVRAWSGHDGCDAVQLPELADRTFLDSITRLEIGAYDGVTRLEPLYENPDRWHVLRHLFAPDWAYTNSIALLLQSPVVNRLEFLGLDLIGRRQIERARLSVRCERLSDLIAAAKDEAPPPVLANPIPEDVSEEAIDARRESEDFRFKPRES